MHANALFRISNALLLASSPRAPRHVLGSEQLSLWRNSMQRRAPCCTPWVGWAAAADETADVQKPAPCPPLPM
jgi:hypothetical protein